MITFEQARRIVEADTPGGQTELYGYESPKRWFPVIAPETTGGRVPGVDKNTGAITWMDAFSEEYRESAVVGQRP